VVAVAPRGGADAFHVGAGVSSVTATAVIAVPAMICASARLLRRRAAIRHMHRGHVGVNQNGDRGAAEGRRPKLLGEHDPSERIHLGAAILAG